MNLNALNIFIIISCSQLYAVTAATYSLFLFDTDRPIKELVKQLHDYTGENYDNHLILYKSVHAIGPSENLADKCGVGRGPATITVKILRELPDSYHAAGQQQRSECIEIIDVEVERGTNRRKNTATTRYSPGNS